MSSLIQLILREVVSRRMVLLLAAVIALFPFLLPLLPWMKAHDGPTLQATSALSLAGGFTVALALIFGATMIGRDLTEKRLGFYFSRPLSAAALWSGKAIGSLLVIFAVALIVITPAFFVTLIRGSSAAQGFSLFRELFHSPAVALIFGGVLLLIGLTHGLSVLVRAQSAWIFLPLAIGLISAVAVWRTFRQLVMFSDTILVSFALVFCGLLLSLFIAGLFQLQLGRADVKRGARALALALSAGLLLSALLNAGYAAWIRATEPEDLSSIKECIPGGDGNWVYLAGVVQRGGTEYSQSFLYDTAGGRWLHTGDSLSRFSNVDFTPDGTRAVWVCHEVESMDGDLTSQVWTVDLEQEDSRPELVLELDDWVRSLVLSADGDRLALVTGNDLQVYELATGRLLAAARTCEDLRHHELMFLSPDVVRFYRAASREETAGVSPGRPEEQIAHGAVVIAELNVARGKFLQTGIIAGADDHGLYRASWSRGGSLMAMPENSGEMSSVVLHDGKTGKLMTTMGSGNRFDWKAVRFLFDGRITALREVDGRYDLVLFSSEGTELRSIGIAGGIALIDGETAPGVVALRVYHGKSAFSEKGAECRLVDLDAGRSRLLERGIQPLVGMHREECGTFGSSPSPGSPGSRLFVEENRRLVRLDPQSGERTLILGREVGG